MSKTRIMLADDHTLFRQGIRTLISAEADMEVVGEAGNGGEAVERSTELRPDVVLMDIGMPGLSSFEATRQIKRARPETKVLFMSAYSDEIITSHGVVPVGVSLIRKPFRMDDLVKKIEDVMAHSQPWSTLPFVSGRDFLKGNMP